MQLGDRLNVWASRALAIGKQSGRDPEVVEDGHASLARAIAQLDKLNENTEEGFCIIGGKLGEFIQAVDQISSDLRDLAGLIAGDHGLRTSVALECVLHHSREMSESAQDGNDLLLNMGQEAGRLKHTLAGFKETVSMFRTLGVLTRIETARLGNAGADFGFLAEDVKSLTNDVKTKVECAMDTAAQLISPIEGALEIVAALKEGQAKELPAVIAGVMSNLASFRDIQNRVRDSSVRLASRSAAILDGFKQLVVSVQFHDITRQQVEHVSEALRRLISESGKGCNYREGDAAIVLALQSSQLADAGRKFAASVASVLSNMDEIARHVQEMGRESRVLSGLSGDESNSFLGQMENACACVLESLTQSTGAQTAIRATSDRLVGAIQLTSGPIEEIREIGTRVEHMSVNARISATQLGAHGNVLSVLAASMYQLASDCKKRSESLVETLATMKQAATRLSVHGGPAPADNPEGQTDCLEAMRLAVQELHSSGEHSFGLIARIVDSGGKLRENLVATRNGFTVGVLFAETLERVQVILKEVGGDTRFRDRPGGGLLESDLAAFAKNYTMQSERDVHAGLTRTAGRTPSAVIVEVPRPSTEDAELGDVEFF